jgi:hypothetical protein
MLVLMLVLVLVLMLVLVLVPFECLRALSLSKRLVLDLWSLP